MLYRVSIFLDSACAISNNREHHHNRRERQRPFNKGAYSLRSVSHCLDNHILENAQRMVRLLASQPIGISYSFNTVRERFPDLQGAAADILLRTPIDDSWHRDDSRRSCPLLDGNSWSNLIARRRWITFCFRVGSPTDLGRWVCTRLWRFRTS